LVQVGLAALLELLAHPVQLVLQELLALQHQALPTQTQQLL